MTQVPSGNVTVTWHWRSRQDLKKRYLAEILASLNRHRVWEQWDPGLRRRVHYERWGRRVDQTNFGTGCKQLEDAMVSLGILVDDTPKHVSNSYNQERQRKTELRTVVTVELVE